MTLNNLSTVPWPEPKGQREDQVKNLCHHALATPLFVNTSVFRKKYHAIRWLIFHYLDQLVCTACDVWPLERLCYSFRIQSLILSFYMLVSKVGLRLDVERG